jgi:hypothetical protein
MPPSDNPLATFLVEQQRAFAEKTLDWWARHWNVSRLYLASVNLTVPGEVKTMPLGHSNAACGAIELLPSVSTQRLFRRQSDTGAIWDRRLAKRVRG